MVGESASNCSWHLRALAKVGLVEPAEGAAADGRTRPWQATAAGFDFSGDAGPAARLARTAVEGVSAQHANDAFHRYLARRDPLPDAWTDVSGAHEYALDVTPDELRALIDQLDALIRPYVRPIRKRSPEGGEIVHVTLRAFPDPGVRGDHGDAA